MQMNAETTATTRRAEAEAELRTRSMYELLGGEAGIRSIVDRFYDLMDGDESFRLIRAMHHADLAPMRQSLFEFLSGWLGGPALYIERKGSPCLTEAHAPYSIDEVARDEWVACISRAMVDAGVEEKYRELLVPAFSGMAEMIRNAGAAKGA
jgi:hemoglobin